MGRSTVLLTALALVLGFSVWTGTFGRSAEPLVAAASINVILVVSLQLLSGQGGRFSLGHAAFMAIGAYTSAAFTGYILRRTGAEESAWVAHPAGFGVILVMAGVLTAGIGLLAGLPMRRLRSDTFALFTFALGGLAYLIVDQIDSLPTSEVLTPAAPPVGLVWAPAMAVLVVVAVKAISASGYGRALRATRDDPLAAEAAGVDSIRHHLIAFVIAAFIAGTAGALHSRLVAAPTSTDFDLTRNVEIAAMVLLGGLRRMPAVVLAALLLTAIPFAFPNLADHRLEIAAGLMLAHVLARPHDHFHPTPMAVLRK